MKNLINKNNSNPIEEENIKNDNENEYLYEDKKEIEIKKGEENKDEEKNSENKNIINEKSKEEEEYIEKMINLMKTKEIENLLEKSGLLIYEHLSPITINDLFFTNRTDYLSAFETIHFIHAVKK